MEIILVDKHRDHFYRKRMLSSQRQIMICRIAISLQELKQMKTDKIKNIRVLSYPCSLIKNMNIPFRMMVTNIHQFMCCDPFKHCLHIRFFHKSEINPYTNN